MLLKDTLKTMQDKSWNGRKYLKIIYLLKDTDIGYIKNSKNSIIRKEIT